MTRSATMICGAPALTAVVAFGLIAVAGASGGDSRTALRDSSGIERGTVTFQSRANGTEVRIRLVGLSEAVARDASHRFHIHVPVGSLEMQYTPNAAAASTATANAGNAGDRMLCGVVE